MKQLPKELHVRPAAAPDFYNGGRDLLAQAQAANGDIMVLAEVGEGCDIAFLGDEISARHFARVALTQLLLVAENGSNRALATKARRAAAIIGGLVNPGDAAGVRL